MWPLDSEVVDSFPPGLNIHAEGQVPSSERASACSLSDNPGGFQEAPPSQASPPPAVPYTSRTWKQSCDISVTLFLSFFSFLFFFTSSKTLGRGGEAEEEDRSCFYLFFVSEPFPVAVPIQNPVSEALTSEEQPTPLRETEALGPAPPLLNKLGLNHLCRCRRLPRAIIEVL